MEPAVGTAVIPIRVPMAPVRTQPRMIPITPPIELVTRGVCHLLCGDDKEAGLWLHRAVKAGNREAEENLKKMNAERRAATIGITQ